jgi:hypothetical protein
VDRLEVGVPWRGNSVDDPDWAVTPYENAQLSNSPLLKQLAGATSTTTTTTTSSSSTSSSSSSSVTSSTKSVKEEEDQKPVVALTKFAPGRNQTERAVANSLVQVHYNMPYMIDGTSGAHFTGTGLRLVCVYFNKSDIDRERERKMQHHFFKATILSFYFF